MSNIPQVFCDYPNLLKELEDYHRSNWIPSTALWCEIYKKCIIVCLRSLQNTNNKNYVIWIKLKEGVSVFDELGDWGFTTCHDSREQCINHIDNGSGMAHYCDREYYADI